VRIAVELKSMGLSFTKSGPSLLWKSFFNQGKGPVFCHRDASSRQISCRDHNNASLLFVECSYKVVWRRSLANAEMEHTPRLRAKPRGPL
jgi:hypothetical protein